MGLLRNYQFFSCGICNKGECRSVVLTGSESCLLRHPLLQTSEILSMLEILHEFWLYVVVIIRACGTVLVTSSTWGLVSCRMMAAQTLQEDDVPEIICDVAEESTLKGQSCTGRPAQWA